MENRRNDKRLLLPDLQVQVKKQSRGDHSSYVTCTPIDISFNGLAFQSSELTLELLQKVDIQLSVGRQTLQASAVICHIEKTSNGTRYGVLYIDINPSLEELFSLSNLTSTQVKEFAASMADHVLIDHSLTENEQDLKKARALLFDAVEAFRDRLCKRVETQNSNATSNNKLAELFEFSTDMSTLTVPMKSMTDNRISRCQITPVTSNTGQIIFKSDDHRQFSNLIEFLQELSDTFEQLMSEK